MRQPSALILGLLIAGCAILVGWLTRPRGQRRLKQRLIAQMRSKHSETAFQAIAKLRASGWLYDGSLRGAILTGSNLKGTDLTQANLTGVWLGYSAFQGCKMTGANLEAADLRVSDLKGTDLLGAYLHKANLRDTLFDSNTRLPHGSRWTFETDTARFTDSKHPEFWRPANPYTAPVSIRDGNLAE